MSTPYHITELLAALEHDPELEAALRERIMGEELGRLPAAVQRNQGMIAELMERQIELSDASKMAMEALTSAVEQLFAMVANLTETVGDHEQRLGRVETDISELKEGQAALLSTVNDIRRQQQEMAERQDRMEADLKEMKEGIAAIAARQDVMDGRLDGTDGRLDGIDGRLDGIDGRLDGIDGRLDGIDGRLDGIDGRLDGIGGRLDGIDTWQEAADARFDSIDQRLDNMQGQLNNLTGTDYERKAVRRAARLVRRHLNVQSGEVVLAISKPDSNAIAELVNNAADRGAITDDDADDLDRADIILKGYSPEGSDVYVVGEVSITIGDRDIDRAYARARILQNASGTTTNAVVIGIEISYANQERARSNNVMVINLED